MKKGGKGGANTRSGLVFEKKNDLIQALESLKSYSLKPAENGAGYIVYFKNKEVARAFKKHQFYNFLKEKGINWKDYLSKQIIPDSGIFIIIRDTLFIIEIKFQQVEGSVDEKLQTCDFKRKQYIKLVKSLNWKVEFIFVLNDWFRNPKYKDVLEYIRYMNCEYVFNEIPLKWLGLPVDD